MSKVVHLSDEAHRQAKDFCDRHGLRMTDWVANMIRREIALGDPAQRQSHLAHVQRSKPMQVYDDRRGAAEDGVPAYAAPPFWAKNRH
jgi:hypothetical protein